MTPINLSIISTTAPLLQWVCFFLLSGTAFWAIMLRIFSKGFLGPASAQYSTGKPFSIFALQFPFSHSHFLKFLEQLPAKTVKPVQWSLKVDYLFMAFAYPFLACSAWYWQRNWSPSGFLQDHEQTVRLLLGWGIALAFLAWLLDVAENLLLSSALRSRKPGFFVTRVLLLSALLKWLCVLFLVVLVLLVSFNNLCK